VLLVMTIVWILVYSDVWKRVIATDPYDCPGDDLINVNLFSF
jgi:hypothetical protein